MNLEAENYIREHYLVENYSQMGRALGINNARVCEYCHKNGLLRPSGNRFKKDYFREWSSNMAYILGYFMADGHMDLRPGTATTISFACHEDDSELIEFISEELKAEFPIKSAKNMRYLHLSSKSVCEDLETLGVQNRKSFEGMKFTCLPEYERDYVRGFLDGDGCISLSGGRLFLVFVSSLKCKSFIEDLESCIHRNTGVTTKVSLSKCSKYNSSWQDAVRITYTGDKALKVLDWIYSDISDSFCLSRKYNKYNEFKKGKENE